MTLCMQSMVMPQSLLVSQRLAVGLCMRLACTSNNCGRAKQAWGTCQDMPQDEWCNNAEAVKCIMTHTGRLPMVISG